MLSMIKVWSASGIAATSLVWGLGSLVLPVRAADVTPGSDSTNALQEIIVTAQRRSESLQSVPISMSAITGESLDNLGITNLDQYERMVPNLSLGAGAGSGGAGDGFAVSTAKTITIRGVFGDNTTGVYLNDTPVPMSLDPRLLDVQRVEILRGPQGTLFGAGSMGGTVRFVANEPSADKTSGKVDAEGSYADHGGGGYSVNGTLNLPLIADNLALRASALSAFDPGLYTRSWGGTPDPSPLTLPYPPGGAPVGQKDHVGDEQDTGVMLSLSITPQILQGLTITPMYVYQRSSSNGYPLADYTPNDFVQNRPLNVPEAGGDSWNFKSLTVKQDAGFGKFILLGSYFTRDGYDLEDGTDSFGFFVPGLKYYVPAPIINDLYYRTTTGEARFESSLPGPVQFIAGVFSSLDKRFFHQYWDAPGANAATAGALGADLVFLQNTPEADRQRAEYINVNYQVTQALQVSAGLRMAYLWHYETYVASGPINGGVSDNYAAHDENQRAPRYTAQYQIAPDQMVYASAAKGYRIGGVNPYVPPLCGAALAALDIPNGHEFNSDSLWSYELGLKDSWLSGRVKSRVAVYDIEWKNTQHTIVLPCEWTIVANSGASRSQGFELEVDALPVDHLNVNFSTGYEDARVTEGSSASETVVGQPLQNVPKWTAAGTLQYSVPFAGRTAFVMGQYTYTDSRVSYNNTPTGLTLPSYGIANLRAGINQGPWQAALFARNLFNKLGEISDVLPDTTNLPGRDRFFVTRPRTVGIQVHRDF
jgi:iron complex outermembrane recepter protein